jgi:CRISPR/Cas system-associated endonuclease/helicase Cas3
MEAIKRLNETRDKRDKMIGDLLYTYHGLNDSQYYKKESYLNSLPFKTLVNLCKKRIP